MGTKNKRFSIEYLFDLVELQRHAVGISFIPGSRSYRKYKNGITLLQITNVTPEDALHRILSKTFTYGEVVGKGYIVTFPMTTEVVFVSFNTEDIEEIEHV